MASDKDKNKKSKNEDAMTPEEKLFKVISGGRDFEFDSDGAIDSSEDLVETGFLTRLETWISRSREIVHGGAGEIGKLISDRMMGLAQKSHVQVHSFSDLVQIKTINRGLLILVVLMGLYLVFDFLFFRLTWNRSLALGNSGSMLSLNAPALMKGDLDRYVAKAEQRNVFSLPAPQVASVTEQSLDRSLDAPPESSGPTTAPSNYKLVGISWDENGYVAMIEYDPTKEGASFVRKGDLLGNGVKVEEIKEFNVLLSQGAQKWELT